MTSRFTTLLTWSRILSATCLALAACVERPATEADSSPPEQGGPLASGIYIASDVRIPINECAVDWKPEKIHGAGYEVLSSETQIVITAMESAPLRETNEPSLWHGELTTAVNYREHNVDCVVMQKLILSARIANKDSFDLTVSIRGATSEGTECHLVEKANDITFPCESTSEMHLALGEWEPGPA